MESAKYKIEVIASHNQVQAALKLHAETYKLTNPFLSGIEINSNILFEEYLSHKSSIIAEQKLSIGVYDSANGELIGATLAVDALTAFEDKTKSKSLKAASALYHEGKQRILKYRKIKDSGKVVEVLHIVHNPKYVKLNLGQVLEEATFKHHIERGYDFRCGEISLPRGQYIFEMLEVPFTCIRIYFKFFTFEEQVVFGDINFGKDYKGVQPCVLFYFIRNDDYLVGSKKVVENQVKKNKKPSL
jgi:hypothetical protein